MTPADLLALADRTDPRSSEPGTNIVTPVQLTALHAVGISLAQTEDLIALTDALRQAARAPSLQGEREAAERWVDINISKDADPRDAAMDAWQAARASAAPPSGFTPTHRHYKGGLYQELTRGKHSETGEAMVIYRHADGSVWCRPAFMFDGTVMSPDGGDDKRRFEPLPGCFTAPPSGWRDIASTARPLSDYHEDMGSVLWWKFPISEPPYVGSPLDLGQTVEVHTHQGVAARFEVGGWPGYHTHFTPLPAAPTPPGTEPRNHDWVPSTLGHGEQMCSRCKITNREAAVLGKLNECEERPRQGEAG